MDNPALEYLVARPIQPIVRVTSWRRRASPGMHDWTTLTEDEGIDVPNCRTGPWSCAVAIADTLFYVQRTGKNEAFFLCHREFMNGESTSMYRGTKIASHAFRGCWSRCSRHHDASCQRSSLHTKFMARLVKIGISKLISARSWRMVKPRTIQAASMHPF